MTETVTGVGAFAYAEWLRQEGATRDSDGPQEADWCRKLNRCADEIDRLRAFAQSVVDAPDAMVSRITRDAAREALDGRKRKRTAVRSAEPNA